MNRVFMAVTIAIMGLCALVPAVLGRWLVIRWSGDSQSGLLIFAFLAVVGGLLGWELAKRIAPGITDRILGRTDRGG